MWLRLISRIKGQSDKSLAEIKKASLNSQSQAALEKQLQVVTAKCFLRDKVLFLSDQNLCRQIQGPHRNFPEMWFIKNIMHVQDFSKQSYLHFHIKKLTWIWLLTNMKRFYHL